MAGTNASWRKSQSSQSAEDEDESFLINSDSDSDSDERVTHAVGNKSDDEDEEEIVEDSDDSAEEEPLQSSDGRLTPLIRKAIRRSIHKLSRTLSSDEREQSNEESGEGSFVPDSDDEADLEASVITASRPKKKYVIESDSSDEGDVVDRESVEDSQDEMESNMAPVSKKSLTSIKDEHKKKPNEITYLDSSDEKEDNVVSDSKKSLTSIKDERKKKPNEITYLDSSEEEGDIVVSDSKKSLTSIKDERKKKPNEITYLDSSEEKESISGNLPYSDLALSIAEEESRNTSLNPLLAQKKAYLLLQRTQMERKLAKTKMLYNTGNLHLLPDKGKKLELSIMKDEKALESIMRDLEALQSEEDASRLSKPPKVEDAKKTLFKQGSLEVDPAYLRPTTANIAGDLGKKAQETLHREQVLTVERLKDLHGSLLGKPSEDQRAKDPRGLKVPLMPHQQYALTWLLWREQKNPPGGVLADDMGLGKTLTMISLVLTANALRESGDASDNEEEWLSSARTQRYLGGTLVVAPASLVAQWESEVKNRCKRGLLTVELYHGNNRETNPKRLARNDLVLTTYNIVAREFKNSGLLYKIRWRRVILDEAHVIRNHKSQTSESVCGLSANKRWVLTGTPVHNKEMDLFAILKFLRCSPFDDVRVWKRWVDNKNSAGHERLATVMKSLMLRRTKQELQNNGSVTSLPDKTVEAIEVQLDPEERLVYDKVMVYSRTLFAQFLAQRAEKAHTFELGAGKYDKPSWMVTHKETQFTKAQRKLLSLHADVQSHEILVLLLRLRQVCCHPSLINSMLDREDIEHNDLENAEDPGHLLSRIHNMSLDDNEEEGEIGVDERVSEPLLTSDNPVFDSKRQSSKLRAVLEKVEEIVASGDKVIVVSQWVSVLDIVAGELKSIKGASCRMFTGKVPVKDRQEIMDDLNSRHSKTNVLLLSLTAGGVGLNLVGANHLLLIDIHWNPQLECQAQDRIYRFGQTKNVFIYKYICMDTIEERIKGLQDKKLEIADNLLSGGGKVGSSKLSLDEMKTLFGM